MLWGSQNQGSLFPEPGHQKAEVHSVLDPIKLLAPQPWEANISRSPAVDPSSVADGKA